MTDLQWFAFVIETYWTVVLIVGLCVVIPLWLWLRLVRPDKRGHRNARQTPP